MLLLILINLYHATAFKGKPNKGPPQAKVGGVLCCGGKKTEAAPHWQVMLCYTLHILYFADTLLSCTYTHALQYDVLMAVSLVSCTHLVLCKHCLWSVCA
jgi:hypothetical protein